MAVTLDINAEQADNGRKITITDVSEERTDPPSPTSVTIGIEKYNYETNAFDKDYGSVTLSEGYTSQDQMEYYVVPDGSNLTLESKQGATGTFNPYSDDIITDGIWRISYGTNLETDLNFLFHFNYESKLGVYRLYRDLPDKFQIGKIQYNTDVESALLRKAFLNSLNYAARFGQLEIIEDNDLILRDLLND